MQNPKKPPLDLVISAIGIAAVVILAGALAGNYFPKQIPFSVADGMRKAGWVLVGLYALGALWQSRAFLADLGRSKKAQGGANSLVFTVAFLALLGLVNFLGAKYHQRVDVTANKQYSLSEQTKKVLQDVKSEIKVVMLVRPGDPQIEQMKELWQEYTYHSDKLKFETIDPDREPSKARAFATQYNTAANLRYGQIFLSQGTKNIEVTGSTEQDFTAGLLKVTQDGQKVVYFLVGHGEQEMAQAQQALGKQNYKTEPLSLLTKKEVPADAEVVVIAGPRSTLMPQELKALEAYLERGGNLYAMLSDKKTGLEEWLTTYGLTVRNDLVVDPQRNINYDPALPVAMNYPYHVINQGLPASFFPLSRSLEQANTMPAGITASPIVETSAEAWGETNLMGNQVAFDKDDAKGPLKLGYALLMDQKSPAPAASASTETPAAEAPAPAADTQKKQNRMVVMGTAQFASDNFFNSLGNGDLFLKSLNWLAEEDALVSIPPKDTAPRQIEMMGNQINTVFWTTVVGAPAGLLFIGGTIWWRRRRA